MTNQSKQPRKYLPAIHLIYGSSQFPMPDELAVANQVSSIEDHMEMDQVDVTWKVQEPRKCVGSIQFGDEFIQVAGLPSPLPRTIVDRTIHFSIWPPQIKAAMRQHFSHLSLVYTGNNPDPVEQMIALYSTAHAFQNEDLLGVVNEVAWTAHPVADFLDPERIRGYRDELPFIIWVGIVKYFVDKQNYWLMTKGHHIFDVPDLAYFVEQDDDPNAILKHFFNLFFYMYEQDVVVTAGDSLEIVDTGAYLRFSEVTEHENFLMGPSGTLVIEEIQPDEINPPT